ncbi:hypothetical protein ABDB91_09780 [Desulfoscipio sp. XC116]|uniref:hypothetical protein n=1 Tax=Desulfoscipio sp. XC116 TaxID=3144975 RepID=UPI00325BAAD9
MLTKQCPVSSLKLLQRFLYIAIAFCVKVVGKSFGFLHSGVDHSVRRIDRHFERETADSNPGLGMKELMALTKYNILQQVAQAIFVHAN